MRSLSVISFRRGRKLYMEMSTPKVTATTISIDLGESDAILLQSYGTFHDKNEEAKLTLN